MFKSLFEFYDAYSSDHDPKLLENKNWGSMAYFFQHLKEFPFWNALKEKMEQSGRNLENDLQAKNFDVILDFLLNDKGLNYGKLPKGLIHFHRYENEVRLAFDEHLVEAFYYASSNKTAHLHFTVSPEHEELFKSHLTLIKPKYENRYNLKFNVDFSNQLHKTDTLAVDENNQPFRDGHGEIVLRPGGHGALIENLNNIDSDIVFVKNIDNVTPDSLKDLGMKYKKVLAGVLLYYKDLIHKYIQKLQQVENLELTDLDEIGLFLQESLCIIPPEDFKPKKPVERIAYLFKKLNRPIRVCGMVKNEGEPGGGPFWVENPDKSASLHIVESAQIDTNQKEINDLVQLSTHFNPVDMVCYLKDYKNDKFNLLNFVDQNAVFIAEKSLNGKNLKALERPGLWNGAMADWITLFVEVPIDSFTPVKTVHDLLRKQHRN